MDWSIVCLFGPWCDAAAANGSLYFFTTNGSTQQYKVKKKRTNLSKRINKEKVNPTVKMMINAQKTTH